MSAAVLLALVLGACSDSPAGVPGGSGYPPLVDVTALRAWVDRTIGSHAYRYDGHDYGSNRTLSHLTLHIILNEPAMDAADLCGDLIDHYQHEYGADMQNTSGSLELMYSAVMKTEDRHILISVACAEAGRTAITLAEVRH